MSVILCFDFGTKSIGVAAGQTITGTASPLAALSAKDGIPDWQQVEDLLNEWQPEVIVVGKPLNMDGSEQVLTQKATKFANRLHNLSRKPVYQYDERLSTVEAKARLFDLGGIKKLGKAKVDSVSACIIFESWCHAHSPNM